MLVSYVLFALVYLSTLIVFGLVIHRLHRRRFELCEEMGYEKFRPGQDGPIGNLQYVEALEQKVHQQNRRLARLIESPKLYLRARRVIGVLDLGSEEFTAELDILNIVEQELVPA